MVSEEEGVEAAREKEEKEAVGEEVAVAGERNAVGLVWVTKNRWMVPLCN